jgi:hypothetical protein
MPSSKEVHDATARAVTGAKKHLKEARSSAAAVQAKAFYASPGWSIYQLGTVLKGRPEYRDDYRELQEALVAVERAITRAEHACEQLAKERPRR